MPIPNRQSQKAAFLDFEGDVLLSLPRVATGPQRAIVTGTDGRDILDGTDGDDQISGGGGTDYIRAGAGNDTIQGGDETEPNVGDLIDGGAGDDAIFGGLGNDLLLGGTGRDTLNGGDGNDTLAGHGIRIDNFRATTTTLSGGTIVPTFSGSLGDLYADDAAVDTINGGAGNDTVYAGQGDIADGGEGNDTVFVSLAGRTTGVTLDLSADAIARLAEAAGATLTNFEFFNTGGSLFNDQISGGAGNDGIYGNAGDDILNGRAGNDSLLGGNGSDTLNGDDGNDNLTAGDIGFGTLIRDGTAGARFDDGVRDDLFGGAGNDGLSIGINDRADGGEGLDSLSVTLINLAAGVSIDLRTDLFRDLSAAGNLQISNMERVNGVYLTNFNDILYASTLAGSNLYGQGGNDIIYGNDQVQFMGGNEGDDILDAGGGNDMLWGGDGRDRLLGGAGNDTLLGDIDNDAGIKGVFANDDYLDGGDGNDRLEGGGGNDMLIGGSGNDSIDGGDGIDTVSFLLSGTGVQASLVSGTATGEGSDTFTNVENLTGSIFNDTLTGNDAANRLVGNEGNDVLNGGGGDDVLIGGLGSDTIDGGAGTDTLILASGVPASAYTVIRTQGGGYTLSRPGDSDTVIGVERVSFDNGATSISIAEFEQQAFDPFAYMIANPDIYAAFGPNGSAAARDHYFTFGIQENRAPGSFDVLAYIASHPDLLRAFGTNLAAGTAHYVQFGRAEGRTVTFDGLVYAASNPDLARAFGADGDAAARHYVTFGFNEGRATATFDGLLYAASNPAVALSIGNNPAAATLDYLTEGFPAGRPTNTFDPLAYAAANVDLARTFGLDARGALIDYVTTGVRQGRPTSGFDAVGYLLTNPDLAGLGASGALTHWLQFGADEGRSGDSLFGRDQATHGLNGVTSDVLNVAGDRDWFQTTLSAGDRLTISLTGAATSVELYDALGNRIAPASGQPAGVFDVSTAGSFYIVVLGPTGVTGGYSVATTVARSASPLVSLDMGVDAVIKDDFMVDDFDGVPLVLPADDSLLMPLADRPDHVVATEDWMAVLPSENGAQNDPWASSNGHERHDYWLN